MDTIGNQLLAASKEIMRLNQEVYRLRDVIQQADEAHMNTIRQQREEIMRLRNAIEKHRDSPIIFRRGESGEEYDSDEELYAVLDKKPDT